jgi:transmembrane sensor
VKQVWLSLLSLMQRTPRSASEWFALVRSGRIGNRLDRQWSQWVAADASREEAYESRELAWELSAELRDAPSIRRLLSDADSLLRTSEYPAAVARGRRLLQPWPAAVAASILAVVALTLLVFRHNSVTVGDYETAKGEQRTVSLEDGSTVSLNTATKMRVKYSRGARSVEMMEGEALFAVSKDPDRPFEVHAQAGVARVVGTEFDVRLDALTVAVSVLEGTVAVAGDETVKDAATVSVTTGQRVSYSRTGQVSAPEPADVAGIRGWLSQRIVFNDVTLAAALEEYNRYSAIPLVLGNPELAGRHINGVFRIGDEAAFLGALEQGLHLKASKSATQTLLTQR